jgi:hypothetical protein
MVSQTNSFQSKKNEIQQFSIFSNRAFYVGLSNGIIPSDDTCYWKWPKFYLFSNCKFYNNKRCCLSGYYHEFEWPNGPIEVKWNENGKVTIGCGILFNPANKLSIFFTANGILMGQFQCGIGYELVWSLQNKSARSIRKI